MQILQPFAGSIQRYLDEIADTDRYRPDHCPQCGAKHPLTGHGFYFRSLVDTAFDGVIRVRRYLCRSCKRTVSLLPEFVLPWLRFRRFLTQQWHGGRSPLLIIVRGMEVFRMNTKAEKLALFRYGLIAQLVIETLPRGELTRRAQEIASRTYDIPPFETDGGFRR